MAINGVGFFSYNKGAIKYSIDDTNLPIINIEITNPKSFNSNFDISKRDTKNIILEIFEKQTEIAEFDEDLKKDFFKGFNKILTSYSSEYKSNKSKYKKAKSEIVKIQPVMNLPKKTTSLKAKPNKSRKIKTLIKAKNKVYKQSKIKKPNYSKFQDELRTAMPPGYRVSKQGNVYFENRINRSDKEGSLTGIVKPKSTIIKLAKKIANYTDKNEHNLSILLLARFLKAKKSIELLVNVIKMQNIYGYMPNNLIGIRNEIYNSLMILLKSKYGDTDYKTIQNSF